MTPSLKYVPNTLAWHETQHVQSGNPASAIDNGAWQVSGDHALAMSKNLSSYYGEHAGVTRLDEASAQLMKTELEEMIEDGFYDQWYENSLVQIIFKNDFTLYYTDIADYDWAEVDSVNDLLLAKQIHMREAQ